MKRFYERPPCPRFKKFDRSPTTRKPHVASKTVNRDKERCYKCREFGHFVADCTRFEGRDRTKPQAYDDYSYHESQFASAIPSDNVYADAYAALQKEAVNGNNIDELNL